MAMDIQKEYAMLQQQVKKCMQTNKPFDKYVKRQKRRMQIKICIFASHSGSKQNISS